MDPPDISSDENSEHGSTPGSDDGEAPPDPFYDERPHGTSVAAMAVGRTLGVAKHAQFIGVKFIAGADTAKPEDIVDAWNWIVDDVIDRGRQGKSIINLSYGKRLPLRYCYLRFCLHSKGFFYEDYIDNNGHVDYTGLNIVPPELSDYFIPLLASAWYFDIATVISLGNDPESVAGDFSPQRYGRVDNALITVASLDTHGRISDYVPRLGPTEFSLGVDEELTGSITTWAQGVGVKIAKAYGESFYGYETASSYATPQVPILPLPQSTC